MLVELKNGETYNGILVNCDIWMNLSLRDVVCTSRVCHSHRIRLHRRPHDAYCLISRSTGSLVP
jgi:small nuclear ribonucleoprotein (snRNP)-like protein